MGIYCEYISVYHRVQSRRVDQSYVEESLRVRSSLRSPFRVGMERRSETFRPFLRLLIISLVTRSEMNSLFGSVQAEIKLRIEKSHTTINYVDSLMHDGKFPFLMTTWASKNLSRLNEMFSHLH